MVMPAIEIKHEVGSAIKIYWFTGLIILRFKLLIFGSSFHTAIFYEEIIIRKMKGLPISPFPVETRVQKRQVGGSNKWLIHYWIITSATGLSLCTKCLKIKSREYKTNVRDIELSRSEKIAFRVNETVGFQLGNEDCNIREREVWKLS